MTLRFPVFLHHQGWGWWLLQLWVYGRYQESDRVYELDRGHKWEPSELSAVYGKKRSFYVFNGTLFQMEAIFLTILK